MDKKCNWQFDYVDGHKFEYWYECKTCGLRDWFSHYGRPSWDYKPRDCKGG